LRRSCLNDVPITPSRRVLIWLRSIGYDGASFLDVARKKIVNAFLAGAFDLPEPHTPDQVASHLHRCDDHGLGGSTATFPRGFTTESRADKGFSHLYGSTQLRSAGIDHSSAKALQHRVCVLVMNAKLPMKHECGNARRLGYHLIRRPKPFREWQVTSVHHRTNPDTCFMAIGTAPEFSGCHKTNCRPPTSRTREATRPPRLGQIIPTGLLGAKFASKVGNAARKSHLGNGIFMQPRIRCLIHRRSSGNASPMKSLRFAFFDLIWAACGPQRG